MNTYFAYTSFKFHIIHIFSIGRTRRRCSFRFTFFLSPVKWVDDRVRRNSVYVWRRNAKKIRIHSIEWTECERQTEPYQSHCRARRVCLSSFIFGSKNYNFFFGFLFFKYHRIHVVRRLRSNLGENKRNKMKTQPSNDRFIPFVRQRKCIARVTIVSQLISAKLQLFSSLLIGHESIEFHWNR